MLSYYLYTFVVCRKFLFGWTGSPDLVNSVAMTALPVPSMIVINATSFHHHFPEEHFEVLTHEALADFLDRIVKDEIQVLSFATSSSFGNESIYSH